MGAATAQAQTVTMNDAMDESEETQEVIVGGKGVLLQMLLDLSSPEGNPFAFRTL